MRIFFSVGEPSGDLHGSNLIRRLKSHHPEIECVGYGGPKMQAAGCDLHFELTSLAVMFLAKVIGNLRLFFRLIGNADVYLRDHDVDAVVLIDYPGFNWWIARKAKRHGIPVFYYGVPQVWAWAPWRVRKIRKFVDHVLCKLPFEVDWFAARNCHGVYVGHPYFDQLAGQIYDESFIESLLQLPSLAIARGEIPENATAEAASTGEQLRLLTLLPGSRDQEVENNLPILLRATAIIAAAVPNLKIAVACFNEKQRTMAERMLPAGKIPVAVELFSGRTPELMKSATVCLACSGSVSMELLYHRKPTVIVYKVKRWVMFAQAILLRTKYITLVNLIAATDIKKTTWGPYDPDAAIAGTGEAAAIMPEYMTTGDPSRAMAQHVIGWLTDVSLLRTKIDAMDDLAKLYAQAGATDKAADYILEQLNVIK